MVWVRRGRLWARCVPLGFAWLSGKHQDQSFAETSDKMLVVFCRVFWLLIPGKLLEAEKA